MHSRHESRRDCEGRWRPGMKEKGGITQYWEERENMHIFSHMENLSYAELTHTDTHTRTEEDSSWRNKRTRDEGEKVWRGGRK